MSLHTTEKLTISSCIIGNVALVAGNFYNGLSSPNTPISDAAQRYRAVFNGAGETATKYFMYCANDTTTTRLTKFITLGINFIYNDVGSTEQNFTLNIPANVPCRVEIPAKLLIFPNGATAVSSKYISPLLPTASTLLDGYVEFTYTR